METRATGNVIYMGNLRRHLLLHRPLCPRLWRCSPTGVASYWNTEQTNRHQKRQRAPSVGKGQSVNFQAQGVGARLRIWATCLETQYCPEYQLPHRLSSFAAGREGGARQVSDMKLSVYLLINSKKCASDLLEREIVLPGWRTRESSR